MSNYTPVITNYAAKDLLTAGDTNKKIRGAQLDAELSAIATMSTTKEDTANKGIANGYLGLNASSGFTVTGPVLGSGAIVRSPSVTGASIGTDSNLGSVAWNASGASTDQKIWDAAISNTNGSTLAFRLVNDAVSVAQNWLLATRSGVSVTNLTFGNATDNPTYTFAGTGQATVGGDLVVSRAVASGSALAKVANASAANGAYSLFQAKNTIGVEMAMLVTSDATTSALLSGGPSSAAGYLYTAGAAYPLSIGTNFIERVRIAGDGSLINLQSTSVQVNGETLNSWRRAKTADESRVSTVTPAVDSALSAVLTAGTYIFDMFVLLHTSAGGILLQCQYSGSQTGGSVTANGNVAAAAYTTSGTAFGSNFLSVNTTNATSKGNYLRVTGTFVASTSGTFALWWCQNSSNAGASIVDANSWMIVSKV